MNRYEIVWTAEDVQSLRPEWSLEKCDSWLNNYWKRASELMVEHGWQVIEWGLGYEPRDDWDNV